MENKDILETFSEREWELAKIYINTRINGKGEKFSYWLLGGRTFHFIEEIERGLVDAFNKKKKEELEKEELEKRLAEEKRLQEEQEKAEEERISKLTTEEKIKEGIFVDFHELSEEMQAEVKEKYVNDCIRFHKYFKRIRYSGYAKGFFAELYEYPCAKEDDYTEFINCKIYREMHDAWEEEYISSLSPKEKLIQGFYATWDSCDEILRNEIRDKFILERKKHPNDNQFVGDFARNFPCDVPKYILEEWLVIADERVKNLSPYECWQYRIEFKWDELSDDEQIDIERQILLVGNVQNDKCQYLVKKCGMPIGIYKDIMKDRRANREAGIDLRLTYSELWEKIKSNLDMLHQNRYTLVEA